MRVGPVSKERQPREEPAGFCPEVRWRAALHSGPALRSARPSALSPRAGRHAADRLEEARRDVLRGAPRAAGRRQAASRFAARPLGVLPLRALLLAELRGARVQLAAVVAALPAVPPQAAEEVAAVVSLVLPREVAAVLVVPPAVAEPRAEAVRVELHAEAAAVGPHVAEAEVAPRALAAVEAERPVLRGVVLPAPQALPEAARPLAVALACRPDRVLPWPVPQQQARFARATRSLQTATQ